MQVIFRLAGATDSVVVTLAERVSPTDYFGTWTVPQDTALWHYYYRAEDMWENVTVYPDTGVFSFHTSGWNGRFILQPSAFILCGERVSESLQWLAKN